MPGFITHYIFDEKVLQLIQQKSLQDILSQYSNVYHLGAQGPDIFFYHPITHLYKDSRNIGTYMHEHDTKNFFYNCLKNICTIKKERDRNICIAYLAGFISHHILDRTAHPYINWYTYNKKGNSHENSFRIHSGIETNIDGAYLKKYKRKRPCNFSHSQLIALTPRELLVVSRFLSKSICNTFAGLMEHANFNITPGFVARSIHFTKLGQKFLIDPSGLKKKCITFVEDRFLPFPILGGMVVTNKPEDYGDYLNLNHASWTNPWLESQNSTASFPQLFSKAAHLCADLLDHLPLWEMHNSHVIEAAEQFTEKIGNRSYISGLLL